MESPVPFKKKKSHLLHIYKFVLILPTLMGKNLSAKKERILAIVKPKFFTDKKSLLDLAQIRQ